MADETLTEQQLSYLATQKLGRLATVDAHGVPQNNPVSFRYNPKYGSIDIGGYALGRSRKFRNVARTGVAAFVVDDIASYQPWRVRCVEIRGTAEALTDEEPPFPGGSRELIRIHPARIIAFGLDHAADALEEEQA